ncbi:hypothetical protein [Bacillus manliponensis]|uniref:hypothetical protein n=1 Tax=Bacillus manliponensis TaxID=574376 RepID=UPI0035117529
MKELMYYLSQNPEVLTLLEKKELSLVINPEQEISNDVVVNILTKSELTLASGYWQ